VTIAIQMLHDNRPKRFHDQGRNRIPDLPTHFRISAGENKVI
jgi:hypothetical protein